jgi:uncharacterized protein (DUF2235 family)
MVELVAPIMTLGRWRRLGKNIVVCLDGTGNQLKARGSTNVVRFFELLDLRDPAAQVAYYDPGVGTFSAQGAWTPAARAVSRVLGLAIGGGMRENLGEAYRFLMGCWEPEDRLYILGFSRGAYTARALAGMLYRVGLLRPGCENLVQYAVSVYARNRGHDDLSGDEGWKRIDRFSAAFARTTNERRSIPIAFMGLWDTVKAAGILGWDLRWPYTVQLPNAATVRHAVSIDERRRPYREYLVGPKGDRPVLNQTWFAGVHSDVGGTFVDDAKLADISLKWMVEGAMDAGVRLRFRAYQRRCALTPEHAVGPVHRMGWVWALATYRTRTVPRGAQVHVSVRDRVARQPGYRRRLPEGVVWEDEDWLALRPRPSEG